MSSMCFDFYLKRTILIPYFFHIYLTLVLSSQSATKSRQSKSASVQCHSGKWNTGQYPAQRAHRNTIHHYTFLVRNRGQLVDPQTGQVKPTSLTPSVSAASGKPYPAQAHGKEYYTLHSTLHSRSERAADKARGRPTDWTD